jgi:hypothetical protein
MGQNMLAVDGTTINFSQFCCAFRPPFKDARNQTRMARACLTPFINMVILLRRSSPFKLALFTWACKFQCHKVPFGLSHIGPGVSLDMHLLAVSHETAVLEMSEHMAVGVSDLLG